MHYFIDGYNLFFRLNYFSLKKSFKEQREELIDSLLKYLKGAKLQATLIFDGHYQNQALNRLEREGILIYYTEKGQTADDYLLELIMQSSKLKQRILVTSDKKLAWQAKRQGASHLFIENFLELLNRLYLKKQRKLDIVRKKEIVVTYPLKKSLTLNEYYEKAFSGTIEIPIKEKEISKPIILDKKKPKNDFERWLEIFENGA